MMEDDIKVRPVSRLQKPFTLRHVLDKCDEFEISNDQTDCEEERDVTQVYDYDKLQPFCLLENMEVDPEIENYDPSNAFPIYRKQMHCVGDNDRLMKKIEICGFGDVVGDAPKIVVYVHYAAYLEFGEYPFDASRLRHKKPVILRLGVDSVVIGMEMAIRTMKKKEKSKFLVHPSLAFGEKGVPPRIPTNATILYEIELLDFSRNDLIDEDTDEEDLTVVKSFEEKLRGAKQMHSHGNNLKRLEKNVNGAIAAYRKAVSLLQTHYQNKTEEDLAKKELMKVYTNLAVCYLEKKQYKKVCVAYNDAMHDCTEFVYHCAKILYLSAKALRFLGDYNEASRRLQKALKIRPNDEDIINELKILDSVKIDHEMAEKNACKKMFGFYANRERNDNSTNDILDVNKEFIELLREQLQEFLRSGEDSCKLEFGATVNEKEFCRSECKKLNLTFRETKTEGLPTFIISKKLGS